MNDSTPEQNSPRKETLDFIKYFARMYRAKSISQQNEDNNDHQTEFTTAYC